VPRTWHWSLGARTRSGARGCARTTAAPAGRYGRGRQRRRSGDASCPRWQGGDGACSGEAQPGEVVRVIPGSPSPRGSPQVPRPCGKRGSDACACPHGHGGERFEACGRTSLTRRTRTARDSNYKRTDPASGGMGPGPFDDDVTSYPVLRVPIKFESDWPDNSTRRSEQHAGSPSKAQHQPRRRPSRDSW
jgi:hypothetical protein